MDPYETILSLRAVRHFTDQPVPDEVLERILTAARWTGSAKNTQPWQFVVARSRQTLQELAAFGPYAGHMQGAAVGIVLAMPPGTSFDAGRVTQNMMLAAWTVGVGSCIAYFREEDKVRALLGIPDTFQVNTAISFGYPLPNAPHTIDGQPIASVLARVGRLPLEDLVHWEKW